MSNAPSFAITVHIEPDSLSALAAAGASLYAMPAFCSSNRTAVPLIVEAIPRLSQANVIRWDESCHGFASYGALSAGEASPAERTVSPGSGELVRLGDVVGVEASLQLAARAGGAAGAVTFRTTETGRFTCGLTFGPGSRPGCAATLTADLDVMIAPGRAMLVMFATSPFEAGAWIERTTSPALLVDMTGGAARAVTFDRNAPGGWREAVQAWASAVPAGTPLTDLLRRAPQPNAPL